MAIAVRKKGRVTLSCLRGLAGPHAVPLKQLRLFLASAKRAAGYEAWDIGCRITTDVAVRRLNKRYRGIDAPTDILSFSTYTLPSPEVWPGGLEQQELDLGDMVLSAEYVSAWCATQVLRSNCNSTARWFSAASATYVH